jgi:hypothetical protein
VIPPGDQLYFPLGIALLEGSPRVLAVANTNFDQRYNAATLISLRVDEMIAQLPAAGAAEVSYIESIAPFVASSVRINNFASDIISVPGAQAGAYRLLVAHRGRNRLQLVEATNGALDCSTDRGTPELGIDCTPAYLARTQFGDPFAIAYSPVSQMVAVGHLLTQQEERQGPLLSALTVATLPGFDERIGVENGEANVDDAYLPKVVPFSNLSGTNALIYVPPEKIGTPLGSFLAAGRRIGVETRTESSLNAFAVTSDPEAPLAQASTISVTLQNTAVIDEARGMALSPTSDRLYLSSRFRALDGTPSSGIAIIELGGPYLRAKSIAEGGDELGIPVVLERTIGERFQRWIYVPDILNDSVWIFDVTTDQALVLGEIQGRAMRTGSDGTFAAHLFDGPAKIVFVEQNGRTFGFVSNFANSTIAVIDATSASPRDHRVIARFGSALDPDGHQEGSE